GDGFAVVHDGDAVAEALGFVHVVGGEEDGAAGEFEAFDEVPELAARLRVEAGGGLVEEEEIGIADESAGHGEALFLAAGKLADARILLLFELHESDHLGGRGSFGEEAAEEADGFEDGELVGELGFLQLDAEALAELVRVTAPLQAEDFDLA